MLGLSFLSPLVAMRLEAGGGEPRVLIFESTVSSLETQLAFLSKSLSFSSLERQTLRGPSIRREMERPRLNGEGFVTGKGSSPIVSDCQIIWVMLFPSKPRQKDQTFSFEKLIWLCL